jgi:DNA-binding NtrC family response regulator
LTPPNDHRLLSRKHTIRQRWCVFHVPQTVWFSPAGGCYNHSSYGIFVDGVSDGTDNLSAQRTILVVDDEPDMLRLVEAILLEQGYKVILAKGAENAIRAFERMPRRPDLILTDVVMPGMSGPALVDHLLGLDPHIRVLFMSGYDDRQIVQKYVVERGFALIPKPFTLQRLGSVVRDVLNGSNAEASSESSAS